MEEKTRTFFDENDNVIQESYTEKNIISNATIQAALGTAFRITGLSSSNEASELALSASSWSARCTNEVC